MKVLKINDFENQKLSEEKIVKRILAGEKELYEMLVRRNNQKLYRVIRSYLKEEVEIEDVMQESYLIAFSKLYQFKLESSFSTWLIRIGINESLARIKKKGKMLHLNNGENEHKSHWLEIPDHTQTSPQEEMIRKETKQLLEAAIDQLELKYRTVYVMKELEEMSIKEISDTLNISVSNVKIRLHRSKEMLKNQLYSLSNHKDIFEFGSNRCDRITEKVMEAI